MPKYIILILILYTPLHCMQSLIEQERHYCFKNLTVLSYDGWQDHAILIAKNATLVHSNIKKTNNITNTVETPKKHPEIKNLFFREPQQHAYDLITVYNPYMLNKKNILIHLKNVHDYLTSSGKFCFFIRTQTNNIPVPEQAFATIYSQISTINLQLHYFTDDQLKEIIWANGYNIVSYQNKTYETVIHNTYDYKETLKAAFIHNIRHHNLPEKTVQQLTEQLIGLVMQRNKKNDLGKLIESWNFTKITLCKTDKLRPPVFLNNSLLSTK
jgi:hypothetical protein